MTPVLGIFARAPELGAVKTRLAAALGDAAALAVYRALLAHTAEVAAAWPGRTVVFGTGDPLALAATPLGSFPCRPQATGGLGARIAAAFRELLPGDSTGALIIGTDCPGLRPYHLEALAAAMAGCDVAFGPALDGGYWGIGMQHASTSAITACCADDLPWSTPALLATTTARLDASGLRHASAAALADLDDLEDLRAAQRSGFLWQSPNNLPSPP